ncbi:hypothetical protein KUCAC02_017942 [Chaenocephalus aceratus]|uniref:Uncharacterized protein n=1 Tax=Chaenocephalus aceratus TaxID=36190 RepID=A0ACB9W6X4_CHAAC|nr:hypothetical protein KUCAC02_017942 [Chaenocephalus aceratus]
MYINHHGQTMRGILKRKFAEVDPCYSSSSSSSSSSPPSSLSSPASSEWESDGESGPSDSQDFTPHSPSSPTSLPTVRSILKRTKLAAGPQSNVRFDQVTVFSFPRCQGFTSVPSHGGATLGMVQTHSTLRRYTMADHALERRRWRRERLRDRRRRERLEALKHKLITSGAMDQGEADRLTVEQVPEEDVPISDAELEDGGFLQPYSSRQRQALLQAAGVKRVDREEKRQLHALRLSREACGCDCQGFCEPETCACSLAGIKCQEDRLNFPCGCTKDGCGNSQGRIEFNSRRVQTHYIHTVIKLEMERRLQEESVSQEEQTGLPEDPDVYGQQEEADPGQSAQDQSCPFGFTSEEDALPLTMPTTPSFHFPQERLSMEESSCSSDMTESSCSSSDSAGGSLDGSQDLPDLDRGLSLPLSMCENNNYSACSQLNHKVRQTANLDFFDSLEGFPRSPSPTLDYFSGRYMDLSLTSDSDIEFFDSDYTSGPLHSSFKLHRHPDSFFHLQLLSSVNLPQYESSTFLLESLIGLTEPGLEQG